MPALFPDQRALFLSGPKQLQGQETKAVDLGPDVEILLSAGCWYVLGKEEEK